MNLGDRMKQYEQVQTSRKLIPRLPVCVRLDGRAFHTFTKGLTRPFCPELTQIMCEVTKHLVKEFKACFGYTQSDEISLIFWSDNKESEIIFGGKIHKINSVLAALASSKFTSMIDSLLPEKSGKIVSFDCRTWQVPSLEEAANVILWRYRDARKNSISMLAQHHFSHKELNKKNSEDKLHMLSEKGIDWNLYPDSFKYGTFIRSEKVLKKLTDNELKKIPEKNRPSGSIVLRSQVMVFNPHPFDCAPNKVSILFNSKVKYLNK